jgi:hypothetical protein
MTALLLLASTAIWSANAATLIMGSDPGQIYQGVDVGPYPGTLTGTTLTEFFCITESKTISFNQSYQGTTAPPSGQAQDEAAFLTSYLLSFGPPNNSPSYVQNYEGPITFAIWDIMDNTAPSPASAPYVEAAVNAYNEGVLTSSYLSNFLVFTPTNSAYQSFITAFQDNSIVNEVVPEPGSMLLLASGLLGLCARRHWLRRKAAR